jgi:hypothetical protein
MARDDIIALAIGGGAMLAVAFLPWLAMSLL